MSTVAKRVAAGAAFLDGHEPGWWERIDLARLDMASECRCVLGQLAADLETPPWSAIVLRFGLRRHGLDLFSQDRPSDCDLGFNACRTVGKRQDREYAALEAEWKRVIGERQATS